MATDSFRTFRFGPFELDAAAGELRRGDDRVRLERRPLDLLTLLVARGGELVPRADIIERLWGTGVFVDADAGINTAVRKIRQVLGDASESPTFVETIPGRGYRFIAPVEAVARASESALQSVRVAVLPFENLGTPEQDYLADGFTEEALTALGQVDPDRLSVIGRTSASAYKCSAKPLAEICRELGATYVVEGSLRSEGRRWRVTARLVRARDQVQTWSAAFDGEPSSMLEFQRELSAAIAHQIQLRLSPERLATLERRRSCSLEAYDLYLRGRHLWNQLTPETNRRAIDHYVRATQLDPEYALAWSGLADAFVGSPINADAAPLDVGARARAAAARAVSSRPDLAECQTSLGAVKYWLDWDWPSAEQAYERALASDPSYAFAHRLLGLVLASTGRHAEARHALSAHMALLARDFPGALELAHLATVIGPAFWIGHFQLAWAYERLGQVDLALDALARAEACSTGNSKTLGLRGYIFATTGRTAEARQILDTLTAIGRERYVPPYAAALIHAGLGERDHAFQRLDDAYRARDVHLVWLPWDTRWDAFRTDAAFAALIDRCGFMAGRVT